MLSQERKDMDRSGEGNDLRFFSFFYGLIAGLSTLVIVLILVWILHFRQGFAWQAIPELQFNWHPLLMAISMIIIYGHGILIYRLLRNERKKKLKLLHAVLMISALIVASVGLKAVFDSHNYATNGPIPNLYSLHSWMGLAAVIMFAMQWLFGCVSFLFPGLRHSLRAAYMPLHVYGGLMIFVIASAAALMGLLEKAIFIKTAYNPLTSEGILMNCIGMAIAFLSCLVVYMATRWQYKRHPLPEDELLLTDQLAE